MFSKWPRNSEINSNFNARCQNFIPVFCRSRCYFGLSNTAYKSNISKDVQPHPTETEMVQVMQFFFTDITWWQILSPLHILSPASIYAGTLKINAKILFLPTLACKHVISCNQNIVRLLDFDPGLISTPLQKIKRKKERKWKKKNSKKYAEAIQSIILFNIFISLFNLKKNKTRNAHRPPRSHVSTWSADPKEKISPTWKRDMYWCKKDLVKSMEVQICKTYNKLQKIVFFFLTYLM